MVEFLVPAIIELKEKNKTKTKWQKHGGKRNDFLKTIQLNTKYPPHVKPLVYCNLLMGNWKGEKVKILFQSVGGKKKLCFRDKR